MPLKNKDKRSSYNKLYYATNQKRLVVLHQRWRNNNTDKQRKYTDKYNRTPKGLAYRKIERLKYRYNLSGDEYYQMLRKQDSVCAICKQPETRTYKGILVPLSVDHNHATDKVRGLLCYACNTGLGHFRESKQFLSSAIDYLHHHNSSS